MYKWNNKMLTYILFSSLLVMVWGNSTTVAKDQLDIVTIAEHLEKEENVSIEEWSVFAREVNNEIATKEEFERKVHTLKQKYPDFQWSFFDEGDAWKAEATFSHGSHLTESIRMVTTKEHANIVTYIIYEVKGYKWDKGYPHFLITTLEHRMNGIFMDTPSVFACMEGYISDNMNSALPAQMEKLLQRFNASEIEGVEDENFVSTSAHSTLFTQSLKNTKINMQLGLRTDGLGARTSFVIGTPIITFEY
ncbi:YwmB family TATA-box binding protein [Peribacillus sp. Hz7]|uniref:YwmB family TATA-box binding protein n=1 Tax=Peribacillus sp. Hz7 TaxID=3344873 RepID=UPI0035CA11B8